MEAFEEKVADWVFDALEKAVRRIFIEK